MPYINVVQMKPLFDEYDEFMRQEQQRLDPDPGVSGPLQQTQEDRSLQRPANATPFAGVLPAAEPPPLPLEQLLQASVSVLRGCHASSPSF